MNLTQISTKCLLAWKKLEKEVTIIELELYSSGWPYPSISIDMARYYIKIINEELLLRL